MTLATQLANATTPGLKAAVTKKMNAAAEVGRKAGKNPTQVIAGFKAAATRIRMKAKKNR